MKQKEDIFNEQKELNFRAGWRGLQTGEAVADYTGTVEHCGTDVLLCADELSNVYREQWLRDSGCRDRYCNDGIPCL